MVWNVLSSEPAQGSNRLLVTQGGHLLIRKAQHETADSVKTRGLGEHMAVLPLVLQRGFLWRHLSFWDQGLSPRGWGLGRGLSHSFGSRPPPGYQLSPRRNPGAGHFENEGERNPWFANRASLGSLRDSGISVLKEPTTFLSQFHHASCDSGRGT